MARPACARAVHWLSMFIIVCGLTSAYGVLIVRRLLDVVSHISICGSSDLEKGDCGRVNRAALAVITLAVAAVLEGLSVWLMPKKDEVAHATNGRSGGRNMLSVISFPGIHRDQWNKMVTLNMLYNFGVVFLPDTENKELEMEIKLDIDDPKRWLRIKDLLRGELWFQLWQRNVRADAGKKLIVVQKSEAEHSKSGTQFGNYQKAEMKLLREEGHAHAIADIKMIADVNDSLEAVPGLHHLLILGGASTILWPIVFYALMLLVMGVFLLLGMMRVAIDERMVLSVGAMVVTLPTSLIAAFVLQKLLKSRAGPALWLFQGILQWVLALVWLRTFLHQGPSSPVEVPAFFAVVFLPVLAIPAWHRVAAHLAMRKLMSLPDAHSLPEVEGRDRGRVAELREWLLGGVV